MMDKHIVCVHGLGHQTVNWSDRWKRGIASFLPSIPDDHWHEVLYADILNNSLGRSNISRANDFDSDAMEDFDYSKISSFQQGLGKGWLAEVRKYFSNPSLRISAVNRFLDILTPLLTTGTTYVLAHSFGAVVSYEGLLALSQQMFSGSIVYLTPGNAVHLRVIRKRLQQKNHATLLRGVRKWVNLQAHGDIVGGSLKDHGFPVTEEYLDLPVVEVGQSLKFVHESYFNSLNVNIGMDIFGRIIEAD